jgi:2-oxoglutarate ferredoxin oxidoreductase subunit gamma
VIRASSPRGFLDLNMDALAAGYALAKAPAVLVAS